MLRYAVLLTLLVVTPTVLEAQTCQIGFLPVGATEIGVQGGNRTRYPTLGVRHFRSHFWAGVFFGDTPPIESASLFASDGVGTYFGELDLHYFGGGVEFGVGIQAGPFMLCADGSLEVGSPRSFTIDKSYLNASGETIGFSREELETPDGTTARLWRLDLSLDYLSWERVSLGAGVFLERRVVTSEATGPVPAHNYAGASVGAGFMLTSRIPVSAVYYHPVKQFSDIYLMPDGWVTGRIGFIL